MLGNVLGLHINSNGGTVNTFIGQQGTPSTASGNQWQGCNTDTQVDLPSSPAASALYLNVANLAEIPQTNGGNQPYSALNGLAIASNPYPGCPASTQPRPSVVTGLDDPGVILDENSLIRLFPNPNSGRITLSGENESEPLKVTVMDMTGKTIYSETILTANYTNTIDLPFEPGIYLVNIRDQQNRELNKKLIIAK